MTLPPISITMTHRVSSLLRPAIAANARRTFHRSGILSVKAGDVFPDVELMEDRHVTYPLRTLSAPSHG